MDSPPPQQVVYYVPCAPQGERNVLLDVLLGVVVGVVVQTVLRAILDERKGR